MRPLRLRIEGFGAYQEAQEISFDDIELFAITGPTGAGKSTILDAMTYALYKSTPRIGSTGLKELKHPAAESAKVELTFAVGEQMWRVVRVVGKENQNRLEFMQPGGDWRTHGASEKVKELDLKLTEILGMDYETFTRAILLPQGQFDSFLRGAPKERRETLIKLYGLESLKSMRDRVGERLKGIREATSRLQGELDALAEADEEKIGAIREEIEGLVQGEAHLSRQAEAADKSLKELEKRFEKYSELESMRRRKATWEAQVADMARIAERLAKAEKAERVWPQLENLQASQAEATQAAKELSEAQQALARLQGDLDKAKQSFDPSQLDALKAELSRLLLLEAQEARLKRYGGSLDSRHAQPLPFDEDRLDALREAEKGFEEHRKASERHGRAQKSLQQTQAELEGLQRGIETLKTQVDDLRSQGQQARLEFEQLEQQLESERVRQGVLAHRHNLRPGEKCPLCEQVVEVLPPEAQLLDLDRLTQGYETAKKQLETLRDAYKEAEAKRKAAQENLPKLQKLLQERQGEEAEAKAELERIQAKLAGLGTPQQAHEERQQRLSGLAEEIRQATGGRAVGLYGESLQAALRQMETQATQLQNLERQLTQAQQTLAVRQERQRGASERLAQAEQSVQSLLQEAGFENAGVVSAARLKPQEAQALQQRQTEHQQEGSFVAKQLQKLEAEMGSQDPITPVQVREARQALESLRQSARAALAKSESRKAELSRLETQLGRRREAMRQKAELDRQTDIWEQLSTDLKGDRFQDFLLERYQTGLLSRASELIKALSQNRYTLGLEEGEYKVLDRWTEAARPVRTLSGGESFMASLSLALSLSEHLSRGRIGALFLDEGFGTLDAETLEQVAGVLEALPTQGRLVGIVTHVEALAERLPARLVVEKSPAGSKVSWRD